MPVYFVFSWPPAEFHQEFADCPLGWSASFVIKAGYGRLIRNVWDDCSQMPTKPNRYTTLESVVEGSREDVIKFLDELFYGSNRPGAVGVDRAF